MDLSTTWLGMELPHPFIPGASPMCDSLDAVRKLEDAGANAIVMHSLFEEQMIAEQLETHAALSAHTESFVEALSYLPDPAAYSLGPHDYLEQIRRIRECTDMHVIGSLNGVTLGGWLEHARLMEQAGASALELNVYYLPMGLEDSGVEIESRLISVVREVRHRISIPLAVKLSPYYTSLPNLVGRLHEAGADGLVLFNRFYQPEIDVDNLTVSRSLVLSDPSELALRLHWIGLLFHRVACPMAVTGGVHTVADAVRAVMCGAAAVQMVSALLRHGPSYLQAMRKGLAAFMEEREYDSLRQMLGTMSHQRCPDASVYERVNYVRMLQSWRGRPRPAHH